MRTFWNYAKKKVTPLGWVVIIIVSVGAILSASTAFSTSKTLTDYVRLTQQNAQLSHSNRALLDRVNDFAICGARQEARLYAVLQADSRYRDAQIGDIAWLIRQVPYLKTPVEFRHDWQLFLARYDSVQDRKPLFPEPPTKAC